MKKIFAIFLSLSMIFAVGCGAKDDAKGNTDGGNLPDKSKELTELVTAVLTVPNADIAAVLDVDAETVDNKKLIAAVKKMCGELLDEKTADDVNSSFYQDVIFGYHHGAGTRGYSVAPSDAAVEKGSTDKNYSFSANAVQKGDGDEKTLELTGTIQLTNEGKVSFMTIKGFNFDEALAEE